MKIKTIYWIVGIAAVAGAGYWIWKNQHDEGKLNAEGGDDCGPWSKPTPANTDCSGWWWSYGICDWVCVDQYPLNSNKKPSFFKPNKNNKR